MVATLRLWQAAFAALSTLENAVEGRETAQLLCAEAPAPPLLFVLHRASVKR